jgi:hypothetical protein
MAPLPPLPESKGVAQTPPPAVLPLQPPEAQFNLGLMFDKCQGMPQDYAEAAKWYRKAGDGEVERGRAGRSSENGPAPANHPLNSI